MNFPFTTFRSLYIKLQYLAVNLSVILQQGLLFYEKTANCVLVNLQSIKIGIQRQFLMLHFRLDV